jgi:hypothetical protein
MLHSVEWNYDYTEQFRRSQPNIEGILSNDFERRKVSLERAQFGRAKESW